MSLKEFTTSLQLSNKMNWYSDLLDQFQFSLFVDNKNKAWMWRPTTSSDDYELCVPQKRFDVHYD